MGEFRHEGSDRGLYPKQIGSCVADSIDLAAGGAASKTRAGYRVCAECCFHFVAMRLKRFPPDLNWRDSQRVKDERIFVY